MNPKGRKNKGYGEESLSMIEENMKRIADRSIKPDQLSGMGCDEQPRGMVEIKDAPTPFMNLPEPMLGNGFVKAVVRAGSFEEFIRSNGGMVDDGTMDYVWRTFVKIRVRYDFPFWAASYIKIKDKRTARDIPFVLNRGQWKLLRAMFSMWRGGKPIRIILLKARQWGGSTLVQIFMIWIQLVHKTQWNSVICAQVENTAKVIRGMYSKVLKYYPAWLLEGGCERDRLTLDPFENSQKTKTIKETGCKITIGSAENPDGVRGDDVAMAHLSEVGLWKATQGKKPEDLQQSIISGILPEACTMIVYESTAKGVGNFFHREWLKAKAGGSAFVPVFVAWYEIELYEEKVEDYGKFISTMDDYEKWLFSIGATLENIKWYRTKTKEVSDSWTMKSEFPSCDTEAFQSTGNRVFPTEDVSNLRDNVRTPAFVGELLSQGDFEEAALSDITFRPYERGNLLVWEMPDKECQMKDRYVVSCDVGKGTTDKADYSVITVFDRYWMSQGGVAEVVAEWRGHIAMDLYAWKCVQVAKYYNDAFVIIESNTLESNKVKGSLGEYVLDEVYRFYDNIYRRGQDGRLGFHTNHSTKCGMVENMKHCIRAGAGQYIERCAGACDEMDVYERKENGELGAVDGCHDDRVMSRMIGLYVIDKMDVPVADAEREKRHPGKELYPKVVNEATI